MRATGSNQWAWRKVAATLAAVKAVDLHDVERYEPYPLECP
jgi:hypothetical protein